MLEEVYNKFQNYIIHDDDLNKLKGLLKNNHEQIIIQNNDSNKNIFRNRIFKILNNKIKNGNNGNILYRYIKDIDDDVIINAKIEFEDIIKNLFYWKCIYRFFWFYYIKFNKIFYKKYYCKLQIIIKNIFKIKKNLLNQILMIFMKIATKSILHYILAMEVIKIFRRNRKISY